MQQTEHYGLSQWDLSDRIQMSDFNADNRKIDTALSSLDTSLGGLTTSLGKRLERSQIVQTDHPTSNVSSCGCPSPVSNWSDWEYVCVVVHYAASITDTTPLRFVLYDQTKTHTIAPLSLPGYMVVFMPRHNGKNPAAGFIFADRFIPFSFDCSYQNICQLNYETHNNINFTPPSIVAFGVK